MYQGCTMIRLRSVSSTVLLTVFFGGVLSSPAQAPVPAPAAASPDNAGRKALDQYLNNIAFRETAARRDMIAKITTRAQAEQRQRAVRAKILGLIGTLPERIPLNPRTTGSTQLEGFRVDKVLFDSQPNFPITALLYVPTASTTSAGKFPAIVMAPGHSPAGKAGDVAFATAFARAGFIVLSYDPIGQGERLQYLDPKSPADKPASLATRPTGEHGEAGLQPTLIGDALARYFLWDGMRAVDYLQSLPEVDAHRIGAFGCSGGGTMTALLGALDPRVAAVGVACYTTSFEALLTSETGVQDSEQSTPNFIASGLDFPDWSELAAPRPYAIIATTEDMFPFAGAKSTETEARHFYSLFGADKDLAFITGPGHHGNLRPILPQILAFFAAHLRPDVAYAKNLPPITDPFVKPATEPGAPAPDSRARTGVTTPARPAFPPPPPASLVQVTPTGQLSSSYPNIATIFTLNRDRAAKLITPAPHSLASLQLSVRSVTHATRTPHSTAPPTFQGWEGLGLQEGRMQEWGDLELGDGFDVGVHFIRATDGKRHAAKLVLAPGYAAQLDVMHDVDASGPLVFAFTPRPCPPGTEETKSPILGPFYLTELRSELVGKTLLGMRVDDVIRAVDYLASRPDVDPSQITAEATDPHLGLVLLHAAVLDPRLKHVTVLGVLSSYRSLIANPLPLDAPQDILPGVLRHYDIPDLLRALGPRVTLAPPK